MDSQYSEIIPQLFDEHLNPSSPSGHQPLILEVQLLQEQLLHPVRGCLVAAERPATPRHHGRGTLRKKAMISGFEKEENNPTHTIPKP
ncbi:hypothetical protein NPIL_207171 [Nephila pilipes]|uniref:Uncharacterized protein n=1 Tax=Nephila pilipes TaxID=299642 RepID=A0A8X6R0E7_NEPPI|nr:hypothetical protein NPIL_207171 [Nephila pilipes]